MMRVLPKGDDRSWTRAFYYAINRGLNLKLAHYRRQKRLDLPPRKAEKKFFS